MRYRSVTLALLALLLVGASGCSALDGGNAQAQAIQENSTAAMQEVSSYEFSMDIEMTAQGETFSVTSNGAVDTEAEEMYLEMDFLGQETTQYIIGDTLYVSSAGQWQQQDVSDQNVWDQQALENQQRLMENSDVALKGNTTIDGERVYEISIDPDPSDVEKVVSQGQGAAQVSVEDASFTQYVRHSDYLIERVDADMTLSAQGQSMDATMSIDFSNYGVDPDIELPAAAEDAPPAGAA